MEKLKIKWIIYIIIGIVISPILISVLCNLADFNQIKIFNAGENSDWISYWGSMLGAVFGVIGTFLILQIQIRKDNERFEQTQIDNTFFNMLELFQKVQDDIQDKTYTIILEDFDDKFDLVDIEKEVDVFDKILDEININNGKYLINKKKEYVQKKYEQTDLNLRKNIVKDLDEALAMIGTIDPTHPAYHVKPLLREIISSIKNVNFSDFINSVRKLEWEIETGYQFNDHILLKFKEVRELNFKIIKTRNEYIYKYNDDGDILEVVDEVFSNYHSVIGNYLRVLHRLIKQIMNSRLNMEKRKEYIGIIRALLSSKELLVIFYNTFYSTRGKGLREQLSIKDKKNNKTEFFADKADLSSFDINQENGTIDLPFFKYKDLIFKDNDFSHIKELSNE